MTAVFRPEAPADRAAIRHLLIDAFAGCAEADLIEALRRDGALALGYVAETAGTIVGFVGYSPLDLADARWSGAALAPVAVSPALQRCGLGVALIRASLSPLRGLGFDFVLVLGEPAFYARLGFTAEAARTLTTPYDGPFMQALALTPAGRKAGGPVGYATAFAALG